MNMSVHGLVEGKCNVKLTNDSVFDTSTSELYSVIYFEKEGLLVSGGNSSSLYLFDVFRKRNVKKIKTGGNVHSLLKWDDLNYLCVTAKKIHVRSINEDGETEINYDFSTRWSKSIYAHSYRQHVRKLARINNDNFAGLTMATDIFVFSYSQRIALKVFEGNIFNFGHSSFFTRIIASKNRIGSVFVNLSDTAQIPVKYNIHMLDLNESPENETKIIKATYNEHHSKIVTIETYLDIKWGKEVIVGGGSKHILFFYDVDTEECFRKINISDREVRSLKIFVAQNNDVFVFFGELNSGVFSCVQIVHPGEKSNEFVEVFKMPKFASDGVTDFVLLGKEKEEGVIRIGSCSYDRKVRVSSLKGMPVGMFDDPKSTLEVQDLKERVEFLWSSSEEVFDEEGVVKYRPFFSVRMFSKNLEGIYKTFL